MWIIKMENLKLVNELNALLNLNKKCKDLIDKVAKHNIQSWYLVKVAHRADKIVVLTTSGDGNYKMENVDAITGKSKVVDAPLFVDRIVKRLNLLLLDKD